MNATKILWGQVLLVCASVLAFVWAATEWTAWRLAFQPQLGRPWFELVRLAGLSAAGLLLVVVRLRRLCARDLRRGRLHRGVRRRSPRSSSRSRCRCGGRGKSRSVTTYGSARWAETREIREAGLLHPDGVLLGRWRGDYLRHDGPEHVLCFAPTRSGKGVGLVVPTLLTWPGSAIVHDIKGENWTLTAGWRARFGRVLLFDPTNAQSAAYNPLLEVRRGEWEVRDVQNIADVLVDPEGALETAEPLGEDQPFAAGRRHPARPLRRGGQDARRRRQFPLRSAAPDRDDAARDDDDAASRDSRACIPSSPAPRASS